MEDTKHPYKLGLGETSPRARFSFLDTNPSSSSSSSPCFWARRFKILYKDTSTVIPFFGALYKIARRGKWNAYCQPRLVIVFQLQRKKTKNFERGRNTNDDERSSKILLYFLLLKSIEKVFDRDYVSYVKITYLYF